MSHLTEGTMRRLHDERETMGERDREHLESCPVCRVTSARVRADHENAEALLSIDESGVDPELALARLLAALDSGLPLGPLLVWEEPQDAPTALPPKAHQEEARRQKQRQKQKLTILGFVGRTFVSVGSLILLFVAYQLVGTNIVTGRQQEALADQLQSEWTSQVVEDAPDLGQGIALIEIPKIGINQVVVEGVEVEDLKKGPGRMPGTAMPGQLGNLVISGHRTTYGAPFSRLDELNSGDEIVVYNRSGPVKYRVSESKIVTPESVEVTNNFGDARLTLTTCHPKFSARQRLIIVAHLVGTPSGVQGHSSSSATVVPGES
ncbi:MAG: class E sortase [Actinomycetota bacterium]